MTPKPTDPYHILADIEHKSRLLSQGLPSQEDVIELWSGIGFLLAGNRFVAAMGDVGEILSVPRYTLVPGVKGWINGIANVRGRLLPILDLAHFFGLSHKNRSSRDRRVLIVEQGEVFSGLIVDSVLGMQYFPADSFQPGIADVPDKMKDFVTGSYERRHDNWNVFSTERLVTNTNFLSVAES